MCSLSALKIGWPRTKRRKTEMPTSAFGNPKAKRGATTATNVDAFDDHRMENVAKSDPRNRLPESPRNTVAGLKLNRRNASVAPDSVIVRMASIVLPLSVATTNIVVAAKNATPEARPSKPSTKFKALVIPTTHRIVTGNANGPNESPAVPGIPMWFAEAHRPQPVAGGGLHGNFQIGRCAFNVVPNADAEHKQTGQHRTI